MAGMTDAKVKALKAVERPTLHADEGGLYVEVRPSGSKSWLMRYRVGGRAGKQEKVVLGNYPAYSLADARAWRDECKALIGRGLSPAALRRGDAIPAGTAPLALELAERFIRNWCTDAHAKSQERAQASVKVIEAVKAENTVQAFAWRWFEEIAKPSNKNSRNIERALLKDVIPAIGHKQLADVHAEDILSITDRIKARGADQMAVQTRNIMKRMFAYAIARQKCQFNPAAAIQAQYIAKAKSREVALTSDELGRLLRGIYQSSMKRQYKLALHLLVITMIRKGELTGARWDEFDFDAAIWNIPGTDRGTRRNGERIHGMKMGKPHQVPLSRQALAMFQELKALSCGSDWVLPGRNDPRYPISDTLLNQVIRGLEFDVQDFVIHDFRRTASTHLHEEGFNSDWIEKAQAHEIGGVRGIYNRAQYIDQRREMLQWWADFVNEKIGINNIFKS